MKRAKKILFSLALVCVLLACLAAGAIYFGAHFIGQKIVEASSILLGTPITFAGEPRITISPPGLELQSLAWEDPAENIEAKAAQLKISLDIWSLFGRELRIREILLDSPALLLKRRDRLKFHKEDQKHARHASPVLIERLAIQQGSLTCTGSTQSLYLQGINLTCENLRPKQDMAFRADFELGLLQSGSFDPIIGGNVALKGIFRYYDPNFSIRQGSISFTPTAFAIYPAFSRPMQLTFETAANIQTGALRIGSASLLIPPAQIDLHGEGNFYRRTFHGGLDAQINEESAPDAMPKIAARGTLAIADRNIVLDPLAMQLGSASGHGKIIAGMPATGPAEILGEVDAGFLNLDTLHIPAIAPAFLQSPKTQEPQKDNPELWPTIDFRIHMAGLEVWQTKITDLGLRLNGNSGIYQISPFNFRLAGGMVDAPLGINMQTGLLTAHVAAKNVVLGALLENLGLDIRGGQTGLEADITARGGSLPAILQSLTGHAKMTMTNLQINELHSLESDIRHIWRGFHLPDMIEKAELTLRASNGTVMAEADATAASDFSAQASGHFVLPEQTGQGHIRIKAYGLEWPITFTGKINDLKFNVSPDFLDNLAKRLF